MSFVIHERKWHDWIRVMIRFVFLTVVLMLAADGIAQETDEKYAEELPALKLTERKKQLPLTPHSLPKNALDYYLLLPSSYFSHLPSTPKRRGSFIDEKTLSDNYLAAEHWFEGDRGGFSVVIRVFRNNHGDVIGILSSQDNPVPLLQQEPKRGQLNSVFVKRPTFWKYETNGWQALPEDILPMISLESILDQYRNRFKAHLNETDQNKFIHLEYTLPKEGNVIEVTGRENFMDPFQTYVWSRYRFYENRFQKEK